MAEEGGKRRNKWLTHVKKTMKSHKGKKFGDILKMAKKTYKGGAEGGAEGGMVEGTPSMSSGAMSPAPVGGRRTRKGRKSRKSRKGGMDEMKGMGYGMY
jgi:hypothetical protein